MQTRWEVSSMLLRSIESHKAKLLIGSTVVIVVVTICERKKRARNNLKLLADGEDDNDEESLAVSREVEPKTLKQLIQRNKRRLTLREFRRNTMTDGDKLAQVARAVVEQKQNGRRERGERAMSSLSSMTSAGSQRGDSVDAPKDLKTPHVKDAAATLKDCIQEALKAVRWHKSESSKDLKTAFSRDVDIPVNAESVKGITCICFEEFETLRQSWPFCADFWDAMCERELLGGKIEKSGKSGSLFWFSDDYKYVLKSIDTGEVNTLRKLMPKYIQHFSDYPNSLLCRFFGCFKLQVDGERLQFVIMNNTFYCGVEVDCKPDVIYDLKGTTEDRWVTPTPGKVLKDLNFGDKIVGLADEDAVSNMQKTIKADATFLESNNIMDYSVLLGVHHLADDCHADSSKELKNLSPNDVCSTLTLQVGFEPAGKACTLVRDKTASKPVIYHFGIIDILQDYNLKKIAAHIIKGMSIGWIREIDTEPPDRYAERFVSFFRIKINTFPGPDPMTHKFEEMAREANRSSDCEGLYFRKEKRFNEAIELATRHGGRLWFRSHSVGLFGRKADFEVEAVIDIQRHAFTFKRVGLPGAHLVSISREQILRVFPAIIKNRKYEKRCATCNRKSTIGWTSEECRRFTLRVSNSADMVFTASTRRAMKLWVVALQSLANIGQFDEGQLTEDFSNLGKSVQSYGKALSKARSLEEVFVQQQFRFSDVDLSGELDLDEIRELWLNLNLDPQGDRELERYYDDVRGSHKTITCQGLRQMMHMLGDSYDIAARRDFNRAKEMPELEEDSPSHSLSSLMGYGSESRTVPRLAADLSARQLQHWLHSSQKEEVELGELQSLLDSLSEPDVRGSPARLTLRGFARLLCSSENSVVKPALTSVSQDMTQPLHEYWIASSHNTYLEGNQFTSRSNVLQYVQILHRGCRCVEIDAWDGPDGEPIVLHGYTATSSILFEDVITAIADHGFASSSYPVVISIEQNCKKPHQLLRQAEIMEQTFGDRLLRPPWNDRTNEIDWEEMHIPSPEEAKHKFIVKSKICDCRRCKHPLEKYARCVFMPTRTVAIHHREVETFHSEGESCSGRHNAHCASFTEDKLQRWIEVVKETSSVYAIRKWHCNFFSRVYPHGKRLGSSNYDPTIAWSVGVQMVSLNYQTSDMAMLLNEALFERCQENCGYVLKSSRSRGQVRVGETQITRIHIELRGGFRLPRPASVSLAHTIRRKLGRTNVSSPFVQITLIDDVGTKQQVRSSIVRHNGYDPFWDFSEYFVVRRAADLSLCFLIFEVIDADSGESMAHNAAQLSAIRQGVRWVQLYRPTGGFRAKYAGLLATFSFEHAQGEKSTNA